MPKHKIDKHVIIDSVRLYSYICVFFFVLNFVFGFNSLIRFSRALIGKNENDFNYIRKLNAKFRCFAPSTQDFVYITQCWVLFL